MSVAVPKGYKQTKVGIIPADWDIVKLGSVLKEKPKYGINAAAVEYSDDLPTYLRITDIDDSGNYKPEKKASVNDKDYKNYILKENEIVFARTGATVGKSYLYNEKDGELIYAGFLIRVSPNTKKLNSIFLKNFTDTHKYWNWIQLMSARSGQPGVNGEEYSIMPIPLPPLKEQEKIAEILTTWDEAISKQEELIKAKEEQKKGLMQKLLSGEVRFGGFSDEWEEVKLDKLVFFQEGPGVRNTQYRKSGVKLLNVGNLNNNTLNLSSTETYISEEEAYGAYKHFLVDEGDLLISCSGINSESFKKKIAFAKKEDLPLCMNTSTMRFKNFKNKLLLEYLYFFFQTLFFEKQVFGVLTGSAQFNFGPTHIKWFKIKLPSLPEQQKIAEVLSLSDDEINLLKNELEELKLQKKGLMQKLLTGEVRVRV